MYEDIFQVKSNNITPSQGRIIIASPLLNDYHFSRTVILMVNHDENGDMGVVLNKDFLYHVSLNDLVKDLEDIPSIPVYKGGPVGRDTMFFIHDIEEIKDSLPLGNGLFMNGDFNQMLDYIKSGRQYEDRVRFYLGYAGWGKGQLQAEMDEDTWIVSELSKSRLFKESYRTLWQNTLNDMGEPYCTWAKYPAIPSMN
ncbi:YqgE/AlgH family protein [Bacteroides sp.]|uniref:YqgE/AlgH family protein n=1 Tax=Bacteroides sp. TaxID=29523 RepID=UPI0025C21781|nr:YqgE/AlgH family protein [Bacteroides sp.]